MYRQPLGGSTGNIESVQKVEDEGQRQDEFWTKQEVEL